MIQHTYTRWQILKLAWTLFWFATGTSAVIVRMTEDDIQFLGKNYEGS